MKPKQGSAFVEFTANLVFHALRTWSGWCNRGQINFRIADHLFGTQKTTAVLPDERNGLVVPNDIQYLEARYLSVNWESVYAMRR
jgi:hypothetical protein